MQLSIPRPLNVMQSPYRHGTNNANALAEGWILRSSKNDSREQVRKLLERVYDAFNCSIGSSVSVADCNLVSNRLSNSSVSTVALA